MYIGIDLGTSGVKLILLTKTGVIKRVVNKEYPLLNPKPLWSEQNPNDWYNQTVLGLEELIKGYELKIKGISFSGQMHGLVILDKNDVVLRNAILWNDQRTVEEVDFLNHEIGIERLLKATGNIALTGLTAPKILWVKKHEPEIFNKIAKVMLPKDYLIYRLSGVFASDVSDLSGTLYFDCEKREYSQDMLKILDLDLKKVPKIYESDEIVGELKPEINERLKTPKGIKIIAGGGDQAVGAIGVGVVNDGDCSISLGTSGVVFVASDTFKIDYQSHLQSYAHANGKYHMMAVMLNAAGAMKWWNEKVFKNDDYESYYQRVLSAKTDNKLFFLPYLTGERSPINDAYAKGVIFGLELSHQQADLDRAIVEGVTFALRDSFELIRRLGIKIKRIKLTGGGAKSNIWAQMISDVLKVEVQKIEAEEGPALGAAILAMVGLDEFSSINNACKEIIKMSDVFYPSIEKAKLYDEKYQQYIKIYPQIKGLYKVIYQ